VAITGITICTQDEDRRKRLRDYKIRYQAIGSSVVQYTRLLDRTVSDYEITHLHENTNYEICVLRLETAAPMASSFGPAQQRQRPGAASVPAAMQSTRRGLAGSDVLVNV